MYKVGHPRIQNSGMLTVFRILTYGVSNISEVQHLLGEGEGSACSLWGSDDRFKPEEHIDYWINTTRIVLKPPIEQSQGAIDNIVGRIDSSLDSVVESVVATGVVGADLRRAAAELARAIETHKVIQIQAKTEATERMTQSVTGQRQHKRERDQSPEASAPAVNQSAPAESPWHLVELSISMQALDAHMLARWDDLRQWAADRDKQESRETIPTRDLRVLTLV
jgi:hypothetical protein